MLHKWDERYHGLVAKNMMENPLEPRLYKEHIPAYDNNNWSSGGLWLHKQPFPLWTMALSMKMFGVHEFALRLPSLLFSTLCIWLTFFIAARLYSEKVGLIAALFLSVNGLIIELSAGRVATDHIDAFFLFLVELSIFFIVLHHANKNRVNLVFAAIACGLAILTKWLPALIVFPLYLALNFNGKVTLKRNIVDLLLLAGVAILVAAPWQLYAYAKYPLEYAIEQSFNVRHFTEGLEGHGRPWWFFLDRIRINVNEAVYVALIWFAYRVIKFKFPREDIFLWIWILLPMLVFSVAKTKMQGYLLFSFPAYFIILALFIEQLTKKEIKARIAAYVFAALIIIFALRYGFERVKPFQSQQFAREVRKELTGVVFPPHSLVFNMPCPLEMMFYADCIAYPQIPDAALREDLIGKEYQLYIVDDGLLSEEILQDDRIGKLRMEAARKMCR